MKSLVSSRRMGCKRSIPGHLGFDFPQFDPQNDEVLFEVGDLLFELFPHLGEQIGTAAALQAGFKFQLPSRGFFQVADTSLQVGDDAVEAFQLCLETCMDEEAGRSGCSARAWRVLRSRLA